MTDRLNNADFAPAMGGTEWGLLLTLATIWGSSFFFFKIMVTALPPMTVALGRVGIAALILNVWLFLRREVMPHSSGTWTSFLVMGTLNNVLPFSLIAFGEMHISSGLASILNATTPIFTVIVANFLTTDERLSRFKILGVLAGFAGVATIVGPTALSGMRNGDIVGEAACLLGAVSYSFAGVFGRRFRNLPAIHVATGQVTGSTIVLIPLVLLVDRPWTLPMPGAAVWGSMIAIAVLCTVIAYVLYFRILAVAGATNLLLVTLLVPASALFLGWFILGEAIGLREIAGLALIVTGLASIDGRLYRFLRSRRLGAAIQ